MPSNGDADGTGGQEGNMTVQPALHQETPEEQDLDLSQYLKDFDQEEHRRRTSDQESDHALPSAPKAASEPCPTDVANPAAPTTGVDFYELLSAKDDEIEKLQRENDRLREEIARFHATSSATASGGEAADSSIAPSSVGRGGDVSVSSKVECLAVGPNFLGRILPNDRLLHRAVSEFEGRTLRITMRSGKVFFNRFHALNLDDSSLPEQKRNMLVITKESSQERLFLPLKNVRHVDVVSNDEVHRGELCSVEEWSKVCGQSGAKKKRKRRSRSAKESKRLRLAQNELVRREDDRLEMERARVQANIQALLRFRRQREEIKRKGGRDADSSQEIFEEDVDFAVQKSAHAPINTCTMDEEERSDDDAAAQIAAATRYAIDTLGLAADDAVNHVLKAVKDTPHLIATVAVNSYQRSMHAEERLESSDVSNAWGSHNFCNL